MSDAISNLLLAIWTLLGETGGLILPWVPLIAWCLFWLIAVNWEKLRIVLSKGGWIPVFLICFAAVLVWGEIAPPVGGTHNFGWPVSNFYGKLIYVTGLLCIMLLCGSVQNSGACDRLCQFPEETEEKHEHAGAAHH